MNDTREDLLCRTCLIKKNEMKWIYDSNVSDLLMDCTSIKVEKNDGLPGYVCVDCEELIRKFHAFRQQCQKSEKILQELKNQKKDFLQTEKTFLIKHPKDDNNLQLTNFNVAKYECVIFKDDSSLKINDCNDTDSFDDDYNQIKVKDESIDYLDTNVENSSDQLKCTVCNKTLSSNATLKRHLKMHETKNIEIKKSEKDDLKQNKDNKFMCMTCDRIFKSYSTLQKHEKTHDSNYVPQECKICKKTYADKKSLQKHMGRHTGNMPYKCTECPKKCYERSDLAKHLKSHLNLEPIKCKDCDMTFMLKEQLKMHVSKAHKAGHICKHCGKAMSSSSNLRKHELVHSNHRPYKCTFCEKSFKNFTARRIHMKQHIDTDRKILCNICGGSFVDIRMHMMKHTLNKPHKCPECGKGFRTNFDLQEHMPKHTGKPRPMPCLCTVCGKRFPYASRLRVHMRKHTGDLPCVCKICGRAFAQTSQLNLHTRKHTGQLPFCCGVCTRSFAASNQLDEHMRVHTGEKPFRCPTCGKSFRVNGTLVVHLRVHTGERPYKCIICEKAFTQPNALKNHLKVHNKSQTEEDVNSNLSEIKPEQEKI